MTRILILLLCLSLGYGHQNGEGITLEQLERALKASEERTKSEIAGVKVEVVGLKGEMVEIKGQIAGVKDEVVGLKGEIAGIKFVINFIVSGVIIIIGLLTLPSVRRMFKQKKSKQKIIHLEEIRIKAIVEKVLEERNGNRKAS